MKIEVALLVLAATILVTECHEPIDNFLFKCSIHDDVCLNKLTENIISQALDGSISDINVKPLEPLVISTSVSILGQFDFTLLNTTVTGAKECDLVKMNTFIDREYADLHINCNIEVDGDYKVTATSPYLKQLLGDTLSYEGTGKLTFTDLNMFFRTFFHVHQHADGQIYLPYDSDKLVQTYMYDGGVEFEPGTIFTENQKSKNFYVNFLEEHSSILKASIGTVYAEKYKNFLAELQKVMFDTVPAKKYITEDLKSYIKKGH